MSEEHRGAYENPARTPFAIGRLKATRELCINMVIKYHRPILERAFPVIQATEDVAELTEWILAATDKSDDELLAMLKRRSIALKRARKRRRLECVRRVCIAFARIHHRDVYADVSGIIETCDNANRLLEWAVTAPEVDDARFVHRVRRDTKRNLI